MTQEEKIKDLEERIAMMDADNSALCTDLEHCKKVAAGLKGHNGQLKTLNQELSRELNQKKAIDEWYDELPWWREIFTWKLLPKKKE